MIPEPTEAMMDNATADQIERANAAVAANMLDDATPKYGSAQGYACALTAIIQTDAAAREPEAGKLREALEPFAAMAEYLDNTDKRRDAIYSGGSPGLLCEVTQADYHRARTALSRNQGR